MIPTEEAKRNGLKQGLWIADSVPRIYDWGSESAILESVQSKPHEHRATLLFLGLSTLIVLLIVFVLLSNHSRSLRYTVIFSGGKGIQVGDKARLNGIDVGEVDAVKLGGGGGEKVQVRLKIAPEHREKVLANSTAFIADGEGPNAAERKIVEIYNSSSSSVPMRSNQMVEGKDSQIELNAWKLGEKAQEWGKSIAKASKELRESAKQLSEGAKRASEGIAEGIRQGIRERREKSQEDKTKEEDKKEASKPEASATPPQGSAPDSNSKPDATSPLDESQWNKATRDLNSLMRDLQSKGRKDIDELLKRLDEAKKNMGPMADKLRERGKEALQKQMNQIQEEIERQLKNFREEERRSNPMPDDETTSRPQSVRI